MGIHIEPVRGAFEQGELKARVRVTVGQGAWLAGIRIVERGGSLEVVFPTALNCDGGPRPELGPVIEFDGEADRSRWAKRILEAYRAQPSPAPPPQPRAPVESPSLAPPSGPRIQPIVLRPPEVERAPRPSPAPRPGLRAGAVVVHFDGASRGNPGDASSAAIIEVSDREPIRASRYLGHETNNVAEYTAVKLALEEIVRLKEEGHPIESVVLKGDSLLVVKQLSGEWKIKDPNLAELADDCKELMRTLGVRIRLEHVPRERNREADRLANECLDSQGAD